MHSPWPGFAAYVLAAHSLQESLLSPEVVPGLQSSHWERPGVEAKWPGSHGEHVTLLSAPGVALAVPAGQSSHAALELDPLAGLKLPAGQGSQTMRVAAPASSQ